MESDTVTMSEVSIGSFEVSLRNGTGTMFVNASSSVAITVRPYMGKGESDISIIVDREAVPYLALILGHIAKIGNMG